MSINLPGLVRGDFISSCVMRKRLVASYVSFRMRGFFFFFVNSCDLVDINIKDNAFTWWNGRIDSDCIFKRLDRFLLNRSFWGYFDLVKLENLARIGLDYAPLLLSYWN